MTATNATTARIVRLAELAGLRPSVETYQRRDHVSLNGAGINDPFGGVQLGTKSGKLIAASITYGNGGERKAFPTARALVAELERIAAEVAARPVVVGYAEPVEVEVTDGTELAAGDLIADSPLHPGGIARTEVIPATIGGRPGRALKVWFDEGAPDVLALPQTLRVRRAIRGTFTPPATPSATADV